MVEELPDAETLKQGFAHVLNRTALGLGVMLGGWMAWQGRWLRVLAVCLLIVVYFYLHRRLDAP